MDKQTLRSTIRRLLPVRLSPRTRWPLLLTALSTLTALALLLNLVPFLRGGFGWRWPYEPLTATGAARMLPGIAAIAVYLFGNRIFQKRSLLVNLSWLFAGAVLIPTAFLYVAGNPFTILYTRTVSELTTGAYLRGTEYTTVAELVRQWPAYMAADRTGHTHLSISPPGWPALYLLATSMFASFPDWSGQIATALRPLQCDNLTIMSHTNAQMASAWLGILSPLWSALTLFPLYLLGRELNDERTARRSAAWWVLLPAPLLFLGTLNTPYPLLAATAVLFLIHGINQRRPGRAVLYLGLSGALTAICLLLNFALVPLGLMAGLLILLYPPGGAWSGPRSFWGTRIRAGAAYAGGLGFIMGCYWLAAGYPPHTLLPLAMSQHLDLDRPYLPWVWLHIWDVILFAGLPVAGLFLLHIFREASERPRRFSLAVALTLLIMAISGTARGETGRVWMFFLPLFLPGVSAMLTQWPRHWRRVILATQLLWLLVLVGVMQPVGTGLSTPPTYAEVAPQPPDNAPFVPVGATFGEALHLAGYRARYHPQTHSISLFLTWEARRPIATSYLFSVLPVAPDGSVHSATEWLPLDYRYPTTCWQPAGPVQDRIAIPLPENARSGDWWLSLSAFALTAEQTADYLPVTTHDGSVDPRQIGIGPIAVPAESATP